MFSKLNSQIQKGLGQTQQTQQQATSQPEVVTFSLARMDEFSHEELQQVIVRYDGQVKKLKALSQEKDTKVNQLEHKLEQVETERQSIEEMLDLRNGEINGLKLHVQTFMTENESLKRLVAALEQSSQQVEDLEAENQQLKLQLEDLKNMNTSLSSGDVETFYKSKTETLQSTNEQLSRECQNLKQSLQRSNEQLTQLAHESEELEMSFQNAEKQIQKKDKLIDQLKQRHSQFLDEKQVADDKISELTEQIKKNEQVTKLIGKSNDTVLTEHAERMRGKDLVIQDLNSQIRQITGKISSMNDKEVYYKRQIESLQRTVYELQQQSIITKQQTNRISGELGTEQPLEGVSDLMNKLLEIQGSPIQISTQCDSSTSVETQQLSEAKEIKVNLESQQLKIELSELHQQYHDLTVNFQKVSKQLSETEIITQELQQQLQVQIGLVQELERRRSMARKEVKQLLLKTPKVGDQIQQAGLLQLRVLKKDLQQLYKDLLTSEDKTALEKTINDMIFNVNDCIQEAELRVTD